eukprot:TRINITY_DN6594_c0_g1_i1.p2 TRINITY_DN6594_c0_g1~~TRINITY_DN6594_c0_g1_i1.p2  ORF type:complete len:142 (-),score=47.18 TRINITY_DN6594_c0_g1_i1:676-1101(-)
MVEFKYIKLMLNIVNLVVDILVAAAGFTMIFYSGGNGQVVILGLYVLVFGIIAGIMETFHLRIIEQYFFFYWLVLGRAFFFIFLGILLINSTGLVFAASILALIMGGVYIILRFFKLSVLPPLCHSEQTTAQDAPKAPANA